MPASGQAADPSTSNIQAIFEVAFAEYETLAGQDLKKHPFVADFDCCNSPDAALDIIQKQARVLDGSNGDKLLRSLSPVVHILSEFSETLGEGIGLIFGPAKVIFTGIAVLLGAVKDVAASRDALVELFERIELFLLRLKLHTRMSLTITMAGLLGKVMAHILSVLALSAEEMKRSLITKSFKMLVGRKDIGDVLQRLDMLTKEETSMTTVSIFGVACDTNAEVKQIKRKLLQTEIRNWLSPPDYSINHRTARDKQHEGTTKWFIEDRRFKEWRVNGSLLWICGNPGSGKSILCSAIIEDLKQMPEDPSLIAYHYFDFKDATKCDFRGLLSSLLFQLADNSERCWGVLRALFSQCEDGVEPPSDTDLTRCLESMVQCSEKIPIYLLIDALDECPDISGTPSAREKVLKFVEDLVSLNQSNLFICITSRPEQDIRNVLDHLTPTSRLVPLHEERGQTEDISGYIRSFVYGDRKMRRWRTEDKELVINSLSNRAHGMFRWVVCQLDTLRRCVPASLGKTLNELPTTLDDTYQRALQGIPHEQRHYAHRLFQCLLVALRPLRVQELAEVFAVEFEGTAPNFMEGWRPENPEEAVLSACSTLVTIVSSEDLRIVQFSHFSVKEFLTSHRLQAYGVENIRYYYIPHDFAHSILARLCLTVLLQFNENVDKGRLEKFPLALYAGQNWVDHAKMKDVASRIQDAMKRLFTPSEPYLAAWVWIHDVDMGQIRESTSTLAERPTPPKATALYYAVLCGFSVLAEYLITRHAEDVNAKCGRHGSPLHAALYEGHLEAVRVLLRHHADPNTKNRYERTPLYVAFDLKRYEVMRLLLEHGADTDMSYDLDQRLLHSVSGLGDVNAGRLLLKHGADANARDSSGWTPLHWASISGHQEVVELLLESRADINARSKLQMTPLHLASEHNHPEVVSLLLESGANVNASSTIQIIPLHLASKHGHLKVVRLLLASGANVNASSTTQMTPLHFASKHGHPEVVHLLLDSGADINAPSSTTQANPLHLASEHGHPEVVSLLLESGAVVNAVSTTQTIALHLASEQGHLKVVSLLLESGANVNASPKTQITALHLASERGHLEVVSLLLESGANFDVLSLTQTAPLHLASRNGHAEVVELLLLHGDNVNTFFMAQTTALHLASRKGHLEVVKCLLEYGANVNALSMAHTTPLHLASNLGHQKIVKVLLENKANVNALSLARTTPLHLALRNGHLEVVRLLMERGAEEVIRKETDQYRTPSSLQAPMSPRQLPPLPPPYTGSRLAPLQPYHVQPPSMPDLTEDSRVGHVAGPPVYTAGPHVLPGWRPGLGHGTPSPLPPPLPPPPPLRPPASTRPVLPPYYVQPPSVPHFPRPAGSGVVLNERNLERMTAIGAQYQGASSSRNSLGRNYSTGHAMGSFHTGQFTPTGRPTENTPLPQSSFDLRNERHQPPRMPVAQPFPVRRRKRKALIIGINYVSHPNPRFRLRYCIEDAHSMANFLCDHLGFQPRDVRIMTDTTPGDRPTKENILAAMEALVHDAQPGDSFFFYFSGHGIQIKDTSGDETDGLDECICAMDYRGDEQYPNEYTAGVIVDGRMHELLVQPLPRECRLTAIFDCCHSGAILDLPYLYSSQGIVKEFTHPYRLRVLRQKLSYADAISIGASKDHQLAREANGKGALRSAFVQCMNAYNNNVTYKELIQSLRNYMKACGFPQRPLLSSSHEIDTDLPFIV